MFDKILIANRGEIAVRITRACQELGIGVVAVYSEADTTALHRLLADEAVLIGPAPAAESYLVADRIIEAALQSGCQAIHPGYGFLSENADFAAAVSEADLSFIGPRAETIRLMGSKRAAREAMVAAGVPIVPGYQASDNLEDLLAAAKSIGFPLLVKATAGGGGKGMRLVESETKLAEAIESARREALNAFGHAGVYLEKVISRPRHIEFQIVGDDFGTVIHLFERECSVQRRHQKIVEEAPSPLLNADLRRRMGQTAQAAAQAAGYVNAGTVEFLVDANQNFYFLEMNTRLQVEHPVTEMVSGIDLVKLQLWIASGEALPIQQQAVTQRGHAIECRIYAEDPANDFLPDIGRLLQVVEPVGPGVRVDSGIRSGDEISLYYDPMLAKLIVLGENRQDAIGKMLWALEQIVVSGLTTNIPFLQDVINHEIFRRGEMTTGFVDENFGRWQPVWDVPDEILIAAALSNLLETAHRDSGEQNANQSDPSGPWQELIGFRLGLR